MAKVLVIPDPIALTATGFMVKEASATKALQTEEIRSILETRKGILRSFAERELGGSARGVAWRRLALSSPATLLNEASIPEAPYELLEGIGAIIVDEEKIDRAALEGSMRALVFDNVRVPLIEPEKPEQASSSTSNVAGIPWHLTKINISAARSRGLTGKKVLVGVLDTGVDSSHPEFAGKSIDFIEFNANGAAVSSHARDAGAHGTHVCGLIAGRTVGVAPDCGLAVAAVLTLPSPSGGLSGSLVQIARGLNWLLTTDFRGPAEDPGVDIINASLGAPSYNPYLFQPLNQARLVYGTLMIAAIGNNGRHGIGNHSSPGNYNIVMGVGATDPGDNVADFSDWGTVTQHGGLAKPDLCAPGVDVVSSVPGGGYSAMSGTSMASPIVAGASALLIEQNRALSLNAPTLTNRVLSLTVPIPGHPGRVGRGRLDLSAI